MIALARIQARLGLPRQAKKLPASQTSNRQSRLFLFLQVQLMKKKIEKYKLMACGFRTFLYEDFFTFYATLYYINKLFFKKEKDVILSH